MTTPRPRISYVRKELAKHHPDPVEALAWVSGALCTPITDLQDLTYGQAEHLLAILRTSPKAVFS